MFMTLGVEINETAFDSLTFTLCNGLTDLFYFIELILLVSIVLLSLLKLATDLYYFNDPDLPL
jgi:hypothetical protein